MDSSGLDDDELKKIEGELVVTGNKLLLFPESIGEILLLLEKLESLLGELIQQPPKSTQDALLPATQALIADKLLRNGDSNVQVAVAVCISQLTRTSCPDQPYSDDRMKDVFQLFMIVLKQLYRASDTINYERACRVLQVMDFVKSIVIMLDLEADAMVVDLFHLFFDIVRFNSSSNVVEHMQHIMIVAIEESDEISLALLRPLIASVRLDNRKSSPAEWELGKNIIEKTAIKIQRYIKDAVNAMNLDVDDYAELLVSLCKDTPKGDIMVAKEIAATAESVADGLSGDEVSKLDGISMAKEENFLPQNPNENGNLLGGTSNAEKKDCAPQMKNANENSSSSDVGAEIVQSETYTGVVHRSKRAPKPKLMSPNEGYSFWKKTGSYTCQVSSSGNNEEKKDSGSSSALGKGKMLSDSSQKGSDSVNEISLSGKVRSKKNDSLINQENELEPLSKLKNVSKSMVKKRDPDTRTKANKGKVIVGSHTGGLEKGEGMATDAERKYESSQKKIDSLNEGSLGKKSRSKKRERVINHENDSEPLSKLRKILQSKVKESGSDGLKKTGKKTVIDGSHSASVEKREGTPNDACSEEKEELSGKAETRDEVIPEKHEFVNKENDSRPSSKQQKISKSKAKAKERGPNSPKKIRIKISAEKGKANNDAASEKQVESLSQVLSGKNQKYKHEKAEDKESDSELSSKLKKIMKSKVKGRRSSAPKKTGGAVSVDKGKEIHSDADSEKKDKSLLQEIRDEVISLKHGSKGNKENDACPEEKDELSGRVESRNEIVPEKHESGDKGNDSGLSSKLGKISKFKGKAKERGADAQKKTSREKVRVDKGKRIDNDADSEKKVESLRQELSERNQKHEDDDAEDQESDSELSLKLKKILKSKVKGRRSSLPKKRYGLLSVEKGKGIDIDADSEEKDEPKGLRDEENDVDLSSKLKNILKSKVKGKRSDSSKKKGKKGISGSSSVSVQTGKGIHIDDDTAKKDELLLLELSGRKETGYTIISEKHGSEDVADKMVVSPMASPKESKTPAPEEEKKKLRRSDADYDGEGLVNLRVMVWWPLDKAFYTGTIESFDPLTKRHKVKYDDDEEEILDLRKERWEPFDERPRQAQFFHKQAADIPSPSCPAKEAKTQQKTSKRKTGSSRKQLSPTSSKRSKN
ncbi:hypothetical protein BUALT_Bualt02G0104600 [Buddleja alternifolia]|uniref:Uncharacterized protein n=1 Tax=Buddleja alternifolia TaxID=168488 RepID=A0AAV6Y648_9LAMI|nr:hypothetical protein BUALT_Bualt02G0104600 [Buddleja alternifolia]